MFCSRSRVAPQSWSTGASGEGGMSTEIARYGGRGRFFLPSSLANPHAVPLCLSRAPATVPVWAGLAVTDTACAARSGSLGHVARCCFLVPRYRPGAASLAPPALLCAVCRSPNSRAPPSTARKQQKITEDIAGGRHGSLRSTRILLTPCGREPPRVEGRSLPVDSTIIWSGGVVLRMWSVGLCYARRRLAMTGKIWPNS